jgi:PAS domain S-box-containing protein
MTRTDEDRPTDKTSGSGNETFVPASDFQALFNSAPDPCIILDRHLHIAAANDAYLRVTMREREDLVGFFLFDVFPVNPADPNATGARDLSASLHRVLKNGVTDVLPVLRYDIRRPAAEGGQFEERYWSPSSTPVFAADNELLYIIHTVRDVTEFIHQKQKRSERENLDKELLEKEAESFAHSQEIAKINSMLKLANEQLALQNEKLRESEQRFASFMLHLPAVAWIKDIDGRYLYANSKLELIFPASISELVGRTDDELLPAETARQFRENDLRALAEGSIQTTEVMRGPDGIEHYHIVSKFALPGADGQPEYIAGVGLDITERKQAEDSLRLSEARYRTLYDANPALIVTVDADLKMISVNPACVTQLGYSRDELENQSVLMLFAEADRPAVVEQLHNCFQNPGLAFHWQVPKIRKDGALLWVEESAQAVPDLNKKLNVLIVCQDITEHKRAEEALRESEERFRLLADTAPVMIWETGADGHCTFVNNPWIEFTGRKLEEELGEVGCWTQGEHPDDRERCGEIYLAAFKERKSFVMEMRVRQHNGEYRWISNTGVPRLAPNGELIGYIGICSDITERKRVGEELQRDKAWLEQKVEERTADLRDTIATLKDEVNQRIRIQRALESETAERRHMQEELREKELLLLQQSRLAAMGDMIGNIAHQWRQPLNMLGLLAQDLPMIYKKGEFTAEYLNGIVKKMLENINHMSKTIDDFRNFFRADKQKVDFKVLEIVNKTLSLLDIGLKALEIRTALVSLNDPVVNGYPSEYAQVLLNIIINARDALVTRHVANPMIKIEVGKEGEQSVVTITDNAGGIPVDIMDKIFDPYFTTKGPDRGTGVGLYMSKIIVEKNMGGSLTARNLAGGAEFIIIV